MAAHIMIRPYFTCEDGSIFIFLSKDEIELTTLLGFMSAGIILISEKFWQKKAKPMGCEFLEENICRLSSTSPQPLLIFFMEYKYATKIVKRGIIPSPIIPLESISLEVRIMPTHYNPRHFSEMGEIGRITHSSAPKLRWKSGSLDPILISRNTYQSVVESDSGIKYLYPYGSPNSEDDKNHMN